MFRNTLKSIRETNSILFLRYDAKARTVLVFDVLPHDWFRDLLVSWIHGEIGRMSKIVVKIMLLRYQIVHVYFWRVEKYSLSSDLNTSNILLKYYALHGNRGLLLVSVQKDAFLKRKKPKPGLIMVWMQTLKQQLWTRVFILKSGLQGGEIFKHIHFSSVLSWFLCSCSWSPSCQS